MIMSNCPPFEYNYINAENSKVSPSVSHAANTTSAAYYRRYLLQKAMSVFKWNLPEWWSRDYFLYCLYCFGTVAVLNTDKFGAIPQQCGLTGYDVFYQPSKALITNPKFAGIKELTIGTQCALFKLQPDYGGIMDMVNYYANMMALAAETAMINLHNSKMSVIFGAQDKNAAETLKKMYDKISSGEPAAFIGQKYFDEQGQPTWTALINNVGQNYIVSDILSDLRKIETMFDTEIGIPNANTDKRERLLTDEINANNVETATKCEMWLDGWKKSCKVANELFGLDMAVEWRHDPKGDDSNVNNEPARPV